MHLQFVYPMGRERPWFHRPGINPPTKYSCFIDQVNFIPGVPWLGREIVIDLWMTTPLIVKVNGFAIPSPKMDMVMELDRDNTNYSRLYTLKMTISSRHEKITTITFTSPDFISELGLDRFNYDRQDNLRCLQ